MHPAGRRTSDLGRLGRAPVLLEGFSTHFALVLLQIFDLLDATRRGVDFDMYKDTKTG